MDRLKPFCQHPKRRTYPADLKLSDYRGAICTRKFDDSHILLRFSSLREPRDPLLKVIFKTILKMILDK
ncbi:hypothetical protein BCR32DRAFT_285421 [Anaeromyces robustus]|uniref:Uncharacterized protein n=1 Tax=Anaeromyces robustus TaxID=1754192 RepID=A0A1Y1WNR3_9FUNG|nr:hypothetical protein BCR32DRAFT_285421 [Anaeromyces robustus]|eukprot:ORX75171.1 hypothetical protein BCR32DRAFT_285421 [Anaeromyces robustus]